MSDLVRPTEFLAIARERRKLLMRSLCEIRRPNAERVFNPNTGTYNNPGYTVIYAGICQVRPKSAVTPAKLEPDVGGAEVVSEAYGVMLPLECPRVLNGDGIVITESDDAWVVARGAMPVGWVQYNDNSTHRELVALAQDYPQVNDA